MSDPRTPKEKYEEAAKNLAALATAASSEPGVRYECGHLNGAVYRKEVDAFFCAKCWANLQWDLGIKPDLLNKDKPVARPSPEFFQGEYDRVQKERDNMEARWKATQGELYKAEAHRKEMERKLAEVMCTDCGKVPGVLRPEVSGLLCDACWTRRDQARIAPSSPSGLSTPITVFDEVDAKRGGEDK